MDCKDFVVYGQHLICGEILSDNPILAWRSMTSVRRTRLRTERGCGTDHCIWESSRPFSDTQVKRQKEAHQLQESRFFRGQNKKTRTVSKYCSARVSHVGLSTKQATELYSDNLLNRTRNPSEPAVLGQRNSPPRRALRRFAVLVGLSTGNPPKIGAFHHLEPYTKLYSDTVRLLCLSRNIL